MEALKNLANTLCEPVPFFILSVLAVVLSVTHAKVWTKPKYFFPAFFAAIVIYFVSFLDPNFYKTAIKGDNLPLSP